MSETNVLRRMALPAAVLALGLTATACSAENNDGPNEHYTRAEKHLAMQQTMTELQATRDRTLITKPLLQKMGSLCDKGRSAYRVVASGQLQDTGERVAFNPQDGTTEVSFYLTKNYDTRGMAVFRHGGVENGECVEAGITDVKTWSTVTIDKHPTGLPYFAPNGPMKDAEAQVGVRVTNRGAKLWPHAGEVAVGTSMDGQDFMLSKAEEKQALRAEFQLTLEHVS